MDDTPDADHAPRARPGGAPAAEPRPARLAVIAAVARNGVIGAKNAMPWHLRGDLKHFRALTTGHRVVMGRKTWESIGRPLPDRENVIVSRDSSFAAPAGCRVARSLEEALHGSALPLPVFCIGGARLYADAIPLADRLHLTEIDATFDGDTRMPPIDFSQWSQVSRRDEVDAASGINYAFVDYVRVRSIEHV